MEHFKDKLFWLNFSHIIKKIFSFIKFKFKIILPPPPHQAEFLSRIYVNAYST